jgi:hypothetical protein
MGEATKTYEGVVHHVSFLTGARTDEGDTGPHGVAVDLEWPGRTAEDDGHFQIHDADPLTLDGRKLGYNQMGELVIALARSKDRPKARIVIPEGRNTYRSCIEAHFFTRGNPMADRVPVSAGPPPADQSAPGESETVQSITVSRPGCKSQVAILPEGVWCSDASGMVGATIQIQGGMPVAAVYDHRGNRQGNGHQLALAVDADGAPFVQVVLPDGTTKHVSGDELLKLAGN